MKKVLAAAAVLLASLTACGEAIPNDFTGRITYSLEAVDEAGNTVLVPAHVLASIDRYSQHVVHIRDGQTGAWLVLPWKSSEDMAAPLSRRQFTYDTRQVDPKDFLLTVRATVTNAPAGTRLRCTILDTFEHPVGVVDEAVVDGSGTVAVNCASQ